MENNNINTPEIIPDETQKKIDTGKKIFEAADRIAKSGTKVTSGGGVFTFIAANIQYILIAMGVAAALAGIGFGLKVTLDANEIKIMDTATVVTEIKKISEFTTYTYIDELIINEAKSEVNETSSGFLGLVKKNVSDTLRSEIVMIVSGVTRAGYDLGKLTENDLKITGDTISVNLPAAEIFDVIVNPSDTRMFVEEGVWSHEEVTAMQVNCRNQMHRNALDRGILEKADDIGKEKVENLFKALGFKVVTVISAPVVDVELAAPASSSAVEDTTLEVVDTTVVS